MLFISWNSAQARSYLTNDPPEHWPPPTSNTRKLLAQDTPSDCFKHSEDKHWVMGQVVMITQMTPDK